DPRVLVRVPLERLLEAAEDVAVGDMVQRDEDQARMAPAVARPGAGQRGAQRTGGWPMIPIVAMPASSRIAQIAAIQANPVAIDASGGTPPRSLLISGQVVRLR